MINKKSMSFNQYKGMIFMGLLSIILGSFFIFPVDVNADVIPASVSIIASPETICLSQNTRIAWSSVDATTLTINQGIGSVLPSGELYVSPEQTTTYTIIGTNTAGGYGTASATVFVNSCSTPTPAPTPQPSPLPTPTSTPTPILADIKCNGVDGSCIIPSNSLINISWTSQGATGCSISPTGWNGTSGVMPDYLTTQRTYSLTCTNYNNFASDSVTVFVVSPTPSPTPIPIPTPFMVTASIYSSPSSICIGQSSYLSWTTNNATQAFINQLGSVNLYSGSQSVSPSQTTTYTINANNNQGGYAVASTTVFVTGSCYIPTSTPTNSYLNIQKFAKNISRGETGNNTSVNASSNQTIEFDIIVSTLSSGTANNVIVTDQLPFGLTYVNNSTSVNGNLVTNSITGSGINIGSLSSNQQALIRFFATVDTVPAGQSRNMINTSQVRSDNFGTTTSNQVNVNVGQGVVLGALDVKTGASSALYVSLLAGLFSTLGFYWYKTRMV